MEQFGCEDCLNVWIVIEWVVCVCFGVSGILELV